MITLNGAECLSACFGQSDCGTFMLPFKYCAYPPINLA